MLARAEGFVDTGDQDIFDACENVMTEVLRSVRNTANEWKVRLFCLHAIFISVKLITDIVIYRFYLFISRIVMAPLYGSSSSIY